MHAIFAVTKTVVIQQMQYSSHSWSSRGGGDGRSGTDSVSTSNTIFIIIILKKNTLVHGDTFTLIHLLFLLTNYYQ